MDTQETLALGDLLIDPQTYQVFRNNKPILLRKKEFELLEFLARNKNIVINRLTILEHVWNYCGFSDTNTLDVHMAALRRKINQSGKKMIQTIHGLGYKISDAK